MINKTTKQAVKPALSESEKSLLGGFETITIFDPNITELALDLFTRRTNKEGLSVDESVATYCISDGIVSDFLSDDDVRGSLSDSDISIFNLIEANYHYLELTLP